MGSDDLFHKRKESKNNKSLYRQQAIKDPYDVVLIVCEGEKTEPNYFNEWKKAFRLSNTNIKGSGRGADPFSVVDFAIKTYRKEPEFDRVYCVFDRDRHTTYQKALDKIRHTKLGKGSKIFAIPSVPCFEFWLLLHFKYTTRPFDAAPGDSVCSKVIEELKKHLPAYCKGDQGIFNKIKDKLDFAIANANKVEQYNKGNNIDNPSTLMHYLVDYLRNLKKK